ncbi:hypothetical protein FRB98_003780 [Tulasnella sp. 332]|nr:hypothetical protein FRB98_003780 [Tulasnella sp. 332]
MSPTKSSISTPSTSAELAAITSEISRSVAGEPGGQSKRAKHVEKTKLQHLTKQLAMRLQYAKLKVDHGWARQNLNEVENLYFHHYGKHQPASQMSFTMRVPVAGTFRSSYPSANESDPSGSKSSPVLHADDDPQSEVDDNDLLDVQAHSGPAGPSRSQTTNPTSSQLRQPSGSRDPHARQAARPNPYPATGAATPSTSYSNSKVTFPSARTGLQPSNASHSPTLKSPTTTSHNTSSFSTPRSPTKSPGKSRLPSSTYQTPRLTKTQNKNTSTPSTLKPPITDSSTTYKPLASLTAGLGSGIGIGALGSGMAGQSTGPTSYESFWSSLGSGGALGMTSAAVRVGSPTKTGNRHGTGGSWSSTTVAGKESITVAAARATAHSSSFGRTDGGTPTPVIGEIHDITALPLSSIEQPPPSSSINLTSRSKTPPSFAPLPTSSRGGETSLLDTGGGGSGFNGLTTDATSPSPLTTFLHPSQPTPVS